MAGTGASSLQRKDVGGFVLLLALFLVAGYILTMSAQEEQSRTVGRETIKNPSVENTRASGSRALYEWTKKLGYKPSVWDRDFSGLPADAAILFCIAPAQKLDIDLTGISSSPAPAAPPDMPLHTLSDEDGRQIRQWVEQGHTLVLFASTLPAQFESAPEETGSPIPSAGPGGPVPTGAPYPAAHGRPTRTTKTYRIAPPAPLPLPAPKIRPAAPPPGLSHAKSFGTELGLYTESDIATDSRRADFAPLQPSTWTQGVQSITIHPGWRLQRDMNDALWLFGSVHTTTTGHGAAPILNPQAVAMTYTLGRGRVIAVADDYFGSNENLVRADNAVFIDRMLTLSAKPGSSILFSEFDRQIIAPSRSLWDAIGQPLRLAAIQLALAALVALVILAPRLGRAEPLPGRTGRSTAEYVTSLAGLYQRAGATATALDSVYRQFLREVCQRYGLPTDITLDRLADAAARRGGIDGADLRRLLVACENALDRSRQPKSQGVAGKDLIVLIRAIERFRKEMGIG